MLHTTHHHSTAADGLRAYGLAGIDLGHRAQERRAGAEQDQRLQQIEARGLVSNFRQMLGDAMVRAGIELAGPKAAVPDTAIRPKPSMP